MNLVSTFKNSNNKKKISWKELQLVHRNPKNTIFYRSDMCIKKYKLFKLILRDILKTSNSEYINNTIIKNNISKKFILTKNSFPYFLENNIIHLLIWINPEIIENKDFYMNNENLNNFPEFERIILEIVQEEFKRDFINKKIKIIDNLIYFENKIENRSINDIKHIHVFLNLN